MVMLVNTLFLSLVTCAGGDVYRHDPHAIFKFNHKAYGHNDNGLLRGFKTKSIACLWTLVEGIQLHHYMFYKASRPLHRCLPFM